MREKTSTTNAKYHSKHDILMPELYCSQTACAPSTFQPKTVVKPFALVLPAEGEQQTLWTFPARIAPITQHLIPLTWTC